MRSAGILAVFALLAVGLGAAGLRQSRSEEMHLQSLIALAAVL